MIVTIIADNYFGYCKKEVKTQLSYSANLHGLCEEEHAGDALVYSSYDLGGRNLTRTNMCTTAGTRSRKSSSWQERPWNCSRAVTRLTSAIPTSSMCRGRSF